MRVTAASFSRWSLYDQCPARFKYATLDKLPEVRGPALERGTLIHDEAEAYLKRELKKLPMSLERFQKDFERLRRVRAKSEVQVAVNESWEEVEWFAPEVWLRAVFDALLVKKRVAWMIDFKTGKQRATHEAQLELYGAVGFSILPQVNVIAGELWYLDTGHVEVMEYEREADAERLKELWVERLRPLFGDEIFAPNPGPLCKWCSFSKAKGGPCKF